jgi:putative lipoic acid-binding regulatory protein
MARMHRFSDVRGFGASRLGFAVARHDNARMTNAPTPHTAPAGDEKGFRFPGVFEITAMGPASARLDAEIPRLLTEAGLRVLHETVSQRASSAGRFVSVTISFHADSRADYEAAHVALRAHPEVKWTL